MKQPLTADVWGAGAEHPYGWLKNPGIYADVERTAIEPVSYTHLDVYKRQL